MDIGSEGATPRAEAGHHRTPARQPDGSWLFAERKLMVDWTETYPSNP